MKTRYLFPHVYKRPAGIVFIIAVIALAALLLSDFSFEFSFFATKKQNFIDEILCVLFIVSGLLFGFSKEKEEDEFIAKIRLESLLWATYINYALLFLAIIFVYDIDFLYCLVINMCSLLVIFVARFYVMLYLEKKKLHHEK